MDCARAGPAHQGLRAPARRFAQVATKSPALGLASEAGVKRVLAVLVGVAFLIGALALGVVFFLVVLAGLLLLLLLGRRHMRVTVVRHSKRSFSRPLPPSSKPPRDA